MLTAFYPSLFLPLKLYSVLCVSIVNMSTLETRSEPISRASSSRSDASALKDRLAQLHVNVACVPPFTKVQARS
jgi:hypothetical protein